MSELFYNKKTVMDAEFSAVAGPVPVLYDLKPKADTRGFFSELWRTDDFEFCSKDESVVKWPEFNDGAPLTDKAKRQLAAESFVPRQINVSYSLPGVLRGLHWQLPPQDMCKFVTCLTGKIYDIVVDIRKASPTFMKLACVPLQMFGETLDPFNSIFVPAGFAHGFYVPRASPACVHYAYDKYYDPSLERGCNPLCFLNSLPIIETNLSAGSSAITLSEKDRNAPKLADMDPADLF
jgi:dTDP-4-dehydrorhamnose 3,5-epimerase